MGNFFKGLGKGLFNIIIIPAYLVGLALSAVAGIFVFLFEFFIKFFKFITGKSLTNLLPEDIQAKEMIEAASKPKEAEKTETVEVVRAEIADPIADFRQERQPVTAQIPSDEDIDFIVEKPPLEIETEHSVPVIENKTEAPAIEEKPEEKAEEIIEEYEPKAAKF